MKTLSDLSGKWSPTQKWLIGLGSLLALVAFGFGLYLRTTLPKNGLYWMNDFQVYYAGGYAVLHAIPLYNIKTPSFHLQFDYQPFAAILFVPFALFSTKVSAIVWTILNVCALFAVLWMSLAMMRISKGRVRLWITLVATIGCILLDSILSNMVFGQLCVMIMLLIFVDFQPWMPRRWAGIATGIAATIKLTPLLFIIYLFLIGRRRTAIQASITFVVAFLIGLAVLPNDTYRYWFKLGFIDLGRMLDATDVEHSLFGFFARLTGNAMTPPAWTIPVCIAVAIYGLIMGIRCVRKEQYLLGVLTIGFTAALISPVSWSYDYVWLAPAFVWFSVATWRSRTILPRILFPIGVLWSIVPWYWPGNRVGDTPAYQVTPIGDLIATLGSPMTLTILAMVTLPVWLGKLHSPKMDIAVQNTVNQYNANSCEHHNTHL